MIIHFSLILSVLLRQLQISDNNFCKILPLFSIKGSLKNMKLIGLLSGKNRNWSWKIYLISSKPHYLSVFFPPHFLVCAASAVSSPGVWSCSIFSSRQGDAGLLRLRQRNAAVICEDQCINASPHTDLGPAPDWSVIKLVTFFAVQTVGLSLTNEVVGGSLKVWRRHLMVSLASNWISRSSSVWRLCRMHSLLWKLHWWWETSARWPQTLAAVRAPRILMIR